MLGAFKAVKGRVGLERDAADFGIQFLQAARSADESSSRPHDRSKVCDVAFSLLPDFVGGGAIVRAPVGVVRVLVGVEIKVRFLLREFMSYSGSAVGAF